MRDIRHRIDEHGVLPVDYAQLTSDRTAHLGRRIFADLVAARIVGNLPL